MPTVSESYIATPSKISETIRNVDGCGDHGSAKTHNKVQHAGDDGLQQY